VHGLGPRSDRAAQVLRNAVTARPAIWGELRSLAPPSTAQGLLAIARDLALVVGAVLLSKICATCPAWLRDAAYVGSAFLIASAQRGLEHLIHYATHFTLVKGLKCNVFIGRTLSVVLGHAFEAERSSHRDHHDDFWGPADPDYRRLREAGLDGLPATDVSGLVSALVVAIPKYMRSTVRYFFFPTGETTADRMIRVGCWLTLVGSAAASLGGVPVLAYWFLPFLFVLPIIRFVGETSEHSALGCGDELLTTRNNVGTLQLFFIHAHADGFHAVHHLYPWLPPHNITRAHQILLRLPEYRDYAQTCHGLLSAPHGKRATIYDMLRPAPRS